MAVILLLCHHLFGLYGDNLNFVFHFLRAIGNVCVPIFVFLSGFGLMRSGLRNHPIGTTALRIATLLANFWFVALIFIPIVCAFTDRTFATVYPNGWWPDFVLEMVGWRMSITGFNPTWWFMALIMPLYVYFPLFALISSKSWIWLLGVAVCAYYLPLHVGGGIMPFTMGMISAQFHLIEKIAKRRNIKMFFLSSVSLLSLVCLRYFLRSGNLFLRTIEGVVAMAFVLTVFLAMLTMDGKFRAANSYIEFMGKHSMNIFFIHTFLYAYLFHHLFSSLPPIAGLMVLTIMSLLSSMFIEKLKATIRIQGIISCLKRRLYDSV